MYGGLSRINPIGFCKYSLYDYLEFLRILKEFIVVNVTLKLILDVLLFQSLELTLR